MPRGVPSLLSVFSDGIIQQTEFWNGIELKRWRFFDYVGFANASTLALTADPGCAFRPAQLRSLG
jgi:hypothetical protein